MTEFFSKEIKVEQGKIHTLENDIKAKKEDVPKTRDVFAKNQEIFSDELDETRKYLDRAGKEIKNPQFLSEVQTDKNHLKTYLQSVAEKGREAFILEGKGGNPDETLLQTVEKSAKATQEKGNQLKNAIPFFIQLDESQSAYNETCKPNLASIEEIKNDESIEPEKKRSLILKLVQKNIKELSEIKKGILTNFAPTEFKDLSDEALKPINNDLEAMGQYQMYYEFQDFCIDPKYKKYVVFDEENGSVTFNDEFKKLPEADQQKIITELYSLKLTIQSNIERQSCPEKHEESFYTGRIALLNGNYIEAKTAFLDFYKTEHAKTEHTPENKQRLNETTESLKQILLMQLAKSENQLRLIEESFVGQEVELSTGRLPIGQTPLAANSDLHAMKEVLVKAKELASSGGYLTIEELIDRLHIPSTDPIIAAQEAEGSIARYRNLFQDENGKKFGTYDVLFIQSQLDNPLLKPEERRALILKYGIKAREQGLPELAKHYYDEYFKPQLDNARQSIPHGEFVKKMREDASFNKQIKEKADQWVTEGIDQYLTEYKEGHNGASPNAYALDQAKQKIDTSKAEHQEKLFSNMAEEAYSKAIHRLTHQNFQPKESALEKSPTVKIFNYITKSTTENSNIEADYWNEAFGNSFINLENYDTNWYQFWKFSDAEWNKQKINFTLEIAMLMASGFAGGLVGEAVAASTLWEELAARGLTQAGREAMQKGSGQFALFVTRELGVKRAVSLGIKITAADTGAMTAVDGALKSVWLGDTSAYESPESFMKAWGKNVAIVAGAKVGSLGYSFVPKPTPLQTAGRLLNPTTRLTRELYNLESKILHATGGLATELTSVTATTIGLALASNPNLTEEEIAKMIQSNGIITLGIKGGHALVGHGGSKEKSDQTPKSPHEEITIKKAQAAEQAKTDAAIAVARARQAKSKGSINAAKLEQEALSALQDAREKSSDVRKDENYAVKIKAAEEAQEYYQLDKYDPLTDPEYLSLKGDELAHHEFIGRKVRLSIQKQIMDEAPPELHEQLMGLASKLVPGTETGPWHLIKTHTSEKDLPPDWQNKAKSAGPQSENKDIYIPGKSLVLEYEIDSPTTPGGKQKFYKILNVATIDNMPSLGMNMGNIEDMESYFELCNTATTNNRNILDPGYSDRQKKLAEVGSEKFGLSDQLYGLKPITQMLILTMLSEIAELSGEENSLEVVIDPATDKPFLNSSDLYRHVHAKLENIQESARKKRQEFSEGHETHKKTEDQSPETDYKTKLREIGKEIYARTDLTPAEKAKMVREKSIAIRKEIAERAGVIGEFIQSYMAKIQFHLESDPNYPKEKLASEIDQDQSLSSLFTPSEVAQIRAKTLESFDKAKYINKFYEMYKSKPNDLFEIQFGFKPKGKITLMKRTFALIFQIHSVEDYKEASGENDSNSELSGGFSTSFSPLKELRGMITTINGEPSSETIENINIHEERHNKNRIIFSKPEETTQIQAPKTTVDQVENQKNYDRYIQKIFSISLEESITRAKDEILAYMKDGSSPERIINTLTKSTLYDYWSKTYLPTIQQEIDTYESMLSPASRKKFQANLTSYPEKHNQIIRDAVKQAFKIGVKRIDELAVTPITSWGKIEELSSTPESPNTKPDLKTIDDLIKYTQQEGGIILYHGGLPDDTDMSKIDLNRSGSQQNKKGRTYGGFYLSNESSKDWAIDYAKKRNGNLHAFRIDKTARILDMADKVIDRLSQKERDEFAKEYDVVKGKDTLGRVQFVLLNKAVVKEVVLDKIPSSPVAKP